MEKTWNDISDKYITSKYSLDSHRLSSGDTLYHIDINEFYTFDSMQNKLNELKAQFGHLNVGFEFGHDTYGYGVLCTLIMLEDQTDREVIDKLKKLEFAEYVGLSNRIEDMFRK